MSRQKLVHRRLAYTRILYVAAFGLVMLLVPACRDDGTEAAAVDDGVDREQEVRDFVGELNSAVAEPDIDFLVERLHPMTFEFWGADECRAAYEALVSSGDTPPVEVREITYVGEWIVDFGEGRTIANDEAYSVTHQSGNMTVAFVDAVPHYFQNCGASPSPPEPDQRP